MHTLPSHTAKTELQLLVRGLVYAPGDSDSDFEAEAAAFNLATHHTPDLILAAVDADDVVAAVRWASVRGMSISVQSMGHGAANAITDGLLISTRYMLELSIDPEERGGPGWCRNPLAGRPSCRRPLRTHRPARFHR